MPCYMIPRVFMHERIAEIEESGERIVSVTPDGATFVVITEHRAARGAGQLEHRVDG